MNWFCHNLSFWEFARGEVSLLSGFGEECLRKQYFWFVQKPWGQKSSHLMTYFLRVFSFCRWLPRGLIGGSRGVKFWSKFQFDWIQTTWEFFFQKAAEAIACRFSIMRHKNSINASTLSSRLTKCMFQLFTSTESAGSRGRKLNFLMARFFRWELCKSFRICPILWQF